jgi:hypothetical protein
MSSGIVSGSDKDKTGEITHRIHEIGLATVICNITRGPEIDVENVEGAAEGPREDELAVAGDGAVGSDAVRALKNPGGDVFATEGPKETEADAVEGFVDAHMTGRRRCMVGGEDVAAKRQRDNDEHEHFLVVLDGLEDNKLALEKSDTVLTDIIAVRSMERRNISFREWSRRRQAGVHEFSVRVLLVSWRPVKRRWDRPRARGGADKGASNELGGRVGGIDGSKEVDVNEMVDEVGTKAEGAACSKGDGKIGRDGSRRKGGNESRRSRVAEE